MNNIDMPIDIIVNAAKGRIKYVHIFILDGCQAQSFRSALNDKKIFSHLPEYMNHGHLYFSNCFTVFPSVTIPCHASIMTGVYPGEHGITGNNWFKQSFDRHDLKNAITGYVRFGTIHNPGLFQVFGKANNDLSFKVKTIFEAYKEKFFLR